MTELGFGVNLNNRFPLLTPTYTLDDLFALGELAESAGFDSVWVGDSLFSKPRYEPLSLLSALSQRTSRVALGTACLVTATRNPLYVALEWATLDRISGGRTIVAACMSHPDKSVRREYAALGLGFDNRVDVFEEGLDVLRRLWREGSINFRGEHFVYDDISFFSGTETAPLTPLQSPPPMWIVSNPRALRDRSESAVTRIISRAARRIATYGDGWLTCCRAQHPDEFQEQYEEIRAAAEHAERDISDYTMAYQVTLNIAESRDAALDGANEYIRQYYPTSTIQSIDLDEWGPIGTVDKAVTWFETFADAGVNHFICRFAAMNQFEQVERFAEEVLPALAPSRT